MTRTIEGGCLCGEVRYRIQGEPLATVKGIFRVAVTATQGAAGQANKHRRQPDSVGLALEGIKNLGDFQGYIGHRTFGRDGQWTSFRCARQAGKDAQFTQTLTTMRATGLSATERAGILSGRLCVSGRGHIPATVSAHPGSSEREI